MSQVVYIFYSKINKELPRGLFSRYLSKLPYKLKEKNHKFIRWQDKHAHLFGKLLMQKACDHLGFEGNAFDEVRLGKYRKPYIPGDINFNITHSGDYVVCAVTKHMQIGIDIQEVLEIDLKHFEYTMNPEQWKYILNSPSPTYTFFRYWTIKESMIKADGRGMHISLLEIEIDSDSCRHLDRNWYFKEFKLNNKYCFTLSSSNPYTKAEFVSVDAYQESKWCLAV